MLLRSDRLHDKTSLVDRGPGARPGQNTSDHLQRRKDIHHCNSCRVGTPETMKRPGTPTFVIPCLSAFGPESRPVAFSKQLFMSLWDTREIMKSGGTPTFVIPAALLGRNPVSFRGRDPESTEITQNSTRSTGLSRLGNSDSC